MNNLYRPEFLTNKCVILSQGYIASGKSTISKQIAARLPAVRLKTKDIPIEVIDKKSKDHRYDKLIDMANTTLKNCETLVLDGTFGDAKYRYIVYWLSMVHEAEIIIVRCVCDDDKEVINRLKKRGDLAYKSFHCMKEYLIQSHDDFTSDECSDEISDGEIPFTIIDVNTKTGMVDCPPMSDEYEKSFGGMHFNDDTQKWETILEEPMVYKVMKILKNIMKENKNG